MSTALLADNAPPPPGQPQLELTAADGTRLAAYEWLAPSQPAAATLAIVHGYAEHAGRYAHVAEALTQHSINVLGVDLRGHGKSAGRRGYVKSYTDFHDDVDALLERAKAAGAPLFVLAHSNGGLIWLHYTTAGRGANFGVQGSVVSSPFLGFNPKPASPVVALMRCLSSIAPTAALPTGIKAENLMRDPDLIAMHHRDKLLNKMATTRWIVEAKDAMDEVQSHAQAGNFPAPLLLLYGAEDKIVDASETDKLADKIRAHVSRDVANGAASHRRDVEIERLEAYYHELVNEPPDERAKVIERIAAWVLARASSAA